jgi:WD40 repeat protein
MPACLSRPHGSCRARDISFDGERVISASPGTPDRDTEEWNREPVRIWSARMGVDLLHLLGHRDRIKDAILSPDGALILTTSADRTARVWDASNGIPMTVLRGSPEELNGAAFSLDGKFAVTFGGDCSLRLWDVRSGRPLGLFGDLVECVVDAQFGWDATTVIGRDQSQVDGHPPGHLVDVLPCELCVSVDRLLTLARQRVRRSLDPTEVARYLQ